MIQLKKSWITFSNSKNWRKAKSFKNEFSFKLWFWINWKMKFNSKQRHQESFYWYFRNLKSTSWTLHENSKRKIEISKYHSRRKWIQSLSFRIRLKIINCQFHSWAWSLWFKLSVRIKDPWSQTFRTLSNESFWILCK